MASGKIPPKGAQQTRSSEGGRNAAIAIGAVIIAVLLAMLALWRCNAAPVVETPTADSGTSAEETKTPPAEEGTASVESTQVAVITTSKGTMRLEFYPDVAPNHVANFIKLASDGFYDGQKWHRVVPGFVIQGGDPLTKGVSAEVVQRVANGAGEPGDPQLGTGGPGYSVAAEFNDRPHLRGTLAMARSSDPNSAGSQFYICIAPQPSLDGQYTVFGRVIEGDEVIDRIQAGDSIDSIKIEPRE